MESLITSAHPINDGDMSSIPFDRYDEEFLSLTEQVRRSLASLEGDIESGGSSVESDLKMTANLLSQCDDLLKQMGLEARSVGDASAKRELLDKVKKCKSKLQGLRSEYNAARNKMDRANLGLGGSAPHSGGASNDHRERLLKTSGQLEEQNRTLDRARRVMAETEETALEITEELGRNREKIESAHGRVKDVSGLTNRARRIVQSMNRREVQQKLAMYVVSAMLIVVLIVILMNLR
uniref:Vesicle transport v-SNARE N-terminal domain-containing protein n=1 Tax=Odontella aurita TaxID=265563 RepID=A0A7S4MGJ4_9STRA|mmetsp:Transcript_21/g.40  ORF Transcript_21/g.40 Transcript_21/m.40 type:complete len:237 (+) Transcript_21:218-928(+)